MKLLAALRADKEAATNRVSFVHQDSRATRARTSVSTRQVVARAEQGPSRVCLPDGDAEPQAGGAGAQVQTG